MRNFLNIEDHLQRPRDPIEKVRVLIFTNELQKLLLALSFHPLQIS